MVGQTIDMTPWWFPYAAAILASIGPIGSFARSFARNAAREQLEKVEGLGKILDHLTATGPNTERGNLSAIGRHLSLRERATDELRIASAAYIELSSRRAGSIVLGVGNIVYGVAMLIACVSVIGTTRNVDIGTEVTVALFSAGALFLVASGYIQCRRRLTTRRLRIQAGVRDELTREALSMWRHAHGSRWRVALQWSAVIIRQ